MNFSEAAVNGNQPESRFTEVKEEIAGILKEARERFMANGFHFSDETDENPLVIIDELSGHLEGLVVTDSPLTLASLLPENKSWHYSLRPLTNGKNQSRALAAKLCTPDPINQKYSSQKEFYIELSDGQPARLVIKSHPGSYKTFNEGNPAPK